MAWPDAQSLLAASDSWQSGSYLSPAALCTGQALDDITREKLDQRLKQVRFEPPVIQHLGGLALFEESFLNYLQRFSFSGKWDANCLHGPLIQLLIAKPVVESLTGTAWMIEKPDSDAVHL
jgi:hypothetical protein